MQTTCLVILLFLGVVFSQEELIDDPGLYSLSGNQCSEDNEWHFRSDYLWNDTSSWVNSRCAAYFELPTPFIPGISKGTQTNINHALIPTLPNVVGGLGGWSQSAGVVDMNSPCRAALWAPFTLTGVPTQVDISLQLWVRSNDQIQQFLLPVGSEIPDAELLQYLPEPYGLLQSDFESFPPLEEQTNLVRIDVIKPDDNGNFYDRAFSLIPDQILVNIPISNWVDGDVVPANGTSGTWIPVMYRDQGSIFTSAGTYALRVASAQSQIGVSWGITDVHVTAKYGAKKRGTGLVDISSFSEELVGSLTHVVPPRKHGI